MAVRSLDAREARSHGRQLRQSGYCVLPSLVSGDLDAWIRRRHLPRELSFYRTGKAGLLPQRRFRAADPAQRRLGAAAGAAARRRSCGVGGRGRAPRVPPGERDVVFGSDERAARRPQGRLAVFRRRARLGVAARDRRTDIQRGARSFRRARPRGLATRRQYTHRPARSTRARTASSSSFSFASATARRTRGPRRRRCHSTLRTPARLAPRPGGGPDTSRRLHGARPRIRREGSPPSAPPYKARTSCSGRARSSASSATPSVRTSNDVCL